MSDKSWYLHRYYVPPHFVNHCHKLCCHWDIIRKLVGQFQLPWTPTAKLLFTKSPALITSHCGIVGHKSDQKRTNSGRYGLSHWQSDCCTWPILVASLVVHGLVRMMLGYILYNGLVLHNWKNHAVLCWQNLNSYPRVGAGEILEAISMHLWGMRTRDGVGEHLQAPI